MEIHLPGPPRKWVKRSRKLFSLMSQLNNGGWRLYNTTNNVRWMQQRIDKRYNQRRAKQNQLNGQQDVILWEVAFVNFNVTNKCKNYV